MYKCYVHCCFLWLFRFLATCYTRSKRPHCFKSIKGPLKPNYVHCFSYEKALMDPHITESILARLDCKMYLERRRVVLFWDNATCPFETLQASLRNIKLAFLPKN